MAGSSHKKFQTHVFTRIISIISSNNFARMGLTKFSRYDNSFCLGSSNTLIGALNKNKLNRDKTVLKYITHQFIPIITYNRL